jgi:hypothetical protein
MKRKRIWLEKHQYELHVNPHININVFLQQPKETDRSPILVLQVTWFRSETTFGLFLANDNVVYKWNHIRWNAYTVQ